MTLINGKSISLLQTCGAIGGVAEASRPIGRSGARVTRVKPRSLTQIVTLSVQTSYFASSHSVSLGFLHYWIPFLVHWKRKWRTV